MMLLYAAFLGTLFFSVRASPHTGSGSGSSSQPSPTSGGSPSGSPSSSDSTSTSSTASPSGSSGSSGDFKNARFTFYDAGLGACGRQNSASDYIVALNQDQYDSGSHCFKEITITYGGKSHDATIVDLCPGCPYGGLDFSKGLFDFFASEDKGVLYGEWSFKDGSGDSTGNSTDNLTPSGSGNTDGSVGSSSSVSGSVTGSGSGSGPSPTITSDSSVTPSGSGPSSGGASPTTPSGSSSTADPSSTSGKGSCTCPHTPSST